MIKIKNLKTIKDFSLIVVANLSGFQTKSYKLNSMRLFLLLAGYTLFVSLFITFIFVLTPAKYLFVSDKAAMMSQAEKINDLNKKVIYLTKDLEEVSSLNKKLRYAIFIGDSNLAKSLQEKKENSEAKRQAPPFGGNLLGILKKLIFSSYVDSEKTIYFINPVDNAYISKRFNAQRGHMGIDYPVKSGSPVYASASGIVIFSDYTAENGYMIMLMHKNNYITVYKHCSAITKKLRDKVFQGEVIALSGNTGVNTTGPHLHFEVWMNGQTIDPRTIILN